MIPKNELNPDSIMDFELDRRQTSRTYRLNAEKQRMVGTADEIEAMKQAVYLILNTPRYEHMIYSWNYGVELADLMGTQISYAMPEIKRRVTEALMQDDRITGVDDFQFSHRKNIVSAEFTVHTVFGDMQAEKEVQI